MTQSVVISVSPLHLKKPSQKMKEVQKALRGFGVEGARCSNVSAIYRLEGVFGSAEIRKIAEGLLCDPVIEKFSVDSQPAENNKLFADVWYLDGVTDPVGESVVQAVQNLKIYSVHRAYSGTRYEFFTSSPGSNGTAEKKILAFVRSQLLNPLVQECQIRKF